MTSPETQTNNIEAKPWDELEHPINYIGTPYLDETTVPEDKKAIYQTVIDAERSAIDQEREDAAAAARKVEADNHQVFLAERRAAALARLDKIAVQSAIESNLDNPVTPITVHHAAPDGSFITPAEAEDMRKARSLRSL